MSYKLLVVKALVVAVCTMGGVQAQGQNKLWASRPGHRTDNPRLYSSLSSLPPTAQVGVSARLGRDLSSYKVSPSATGLHVENVPQRLTADFTPQGITVSHAIHRYAMSLRGYGYGDAIQTVNRVAPVGSLNRVEYLHGPLTEWYVNGPVGLEQGFTVNQRPGAEEGLPLTIVLDLSGGSSASVDQEKTGLNLSPRVGNPDLRYAGLTARDATGQKLQAWLELQGTQVRLHVRDAGALYPVVVDPVFQRAELTASDGANGDFMGISVAISGNTVVVGAPNAAIEGRLAQGAAYVFVKPVSGWANMTETAKLTAVDGLAGDSFGGSVGIAGNTIVVGACSQSGMCNGPGKVYVFVKPSSGWHTTSNYAAVLAASDGQANDGFSNEMSISGDGNTVVVGAANATVDGQTSAGKVYVFVKPTRGRKTITETAQLTEPTPAAFDDFCCVSVSADGSTIFVGALQFDFPDNIPTGPGKAYIYIRPAGGWKSTSNAQAVLTASDGGFGDVFGFCQAGSSCLSSDGTTVLAAAPFANGTAGKGYIFVEPIGGWKTTSAFDAELTPSDGRTQFLGWSAAITHNVALLGAVAGSQGGAAYVMARPASGWKTTSQFTYELVPSDGASGDDFAFSLALSGQTAVVGNVEAGSGGPGAAYVFGK